MNEINRKILSACLRGVDVTEVFSPERVNQVCHEYGLIAGTSFYIRSGWNFDEEEDRRKAWKQIRAGDPVFIIGSPPCTMFSKLQNMNPVGVFADERAEGCRMLDHSVE